MSLNYVTWVNCVACIRCLILIKQLQYCRVRVVSFSCRCTFIDVHQSLHAARGRQNNFCHRQLFLIRFLVFALGDKTLFQVFSAKIFFVINPSFMNRILPKLKYRCRPSSSINVVSFIIFDQGIRRYGAKIKIFYGIFQVIQPFFQVFWAVIPQMTPENFQLWQ